MKPSPAKRRARAGPGPKKSCWARARVGPKNRAARFPLVCSLFFLDPLRLFFGSTSVNTGKVGIVPGRCRAPCLPASTRPLAASVFFVCGPHLHRQVLPTLLPSPLVVSPLRRVACSNLGQLASSRFLSRAASSPPPPRPLQLPPPLSHSAAAPAPSLATPCLPFLRCAPLPIYLYAGASGLSHPRSLHLYLISPCPTIEAC
jgi:hypothetical protein